MPVDENATCWFRNFYVCPVCEHEWTDEWSVTCDDDCPRCGARCISPIESEGITTEE
jgi:hypothetical protein